MDNEKQLLASIFKLNSDFLSEEMKALDDMINQNKSGKNINLGMREDLASKNKAKNAKTS